MSSAKLQAQRGGHGLGEDEEASKRAQQSAQAQKAHQMRLSRLRQSSTVDAHSEILEVAGSVQRSSLGPESPIAQQGPGRRKTLSEADGGKEFYGRSVSASPTGHTVRTMHSEGSERPLHSANASQASDAPIRQAQRKEERDEKEEETGAGVIEYLGRNYEYFPGNTIICFWGRCQTTRDLPMNLLTAVLILVPTGLFGGYS